MRLLAQILLLTIDDFALQPMDATQTADFYELVVTRHHNTSTALTSSRGLDELPAEMRLAAAVDRFTSTTHVIPGACQIKHSRTSFG
jgi:DNA replication protein DnaC